MDDKTVAQRISASFPTPNRLSSPVQGAQTRSQFDLKNLHVPQPQSQSKLCQATQQVVEDGLTEASFSSTLGHAGGRQLLLVTDHDLHKQV